MRKIEERYYFAYGSNMNLGQMRFRCPDAEVVGNVRLEDYRLAFRGRAPGNGVATVLPEKGSCVDGVLWRITEACEKNLDFYEGFPNFYGKETIQVKDQAGAFCWHDNHFNSSSTGYDAASGISTCRCMGSGIFSWDGDLGCKGRTDSGSSGYPSP